MAERYLITGGAGYVGSHCVAALIEQGAACVVLDNLSTGHRDAVPPEADLLVGDLSDAAFVADALGRGPWDGVLHFAARSLVGESMRDPFLYFRENAGAGFGFIDACVRHGVPRFILSSTAALFGKPERVPIAEDSPIEPITPYGDSKWMLERALAWADSVHGMRSACLRYFNAAGADPLGRRGEDHDPETHLIPLAIDANLGLRDPLRIFGDDYPTPDGSCVRDYIHVCDLADAHVRALGLLDRRSVTYNLGVGRGFSVHEVIAAVDAVSGRPTPREMAHRRPGDPPALVADPSAFMSATGWKPRFDTIEDIVATAYAWRRDHPRGYADKAHPT